MAIKVKNINGTIGNKCNCNSWLHHWEKHSKKSASLCSEKSCHKNAEHGAHIQKDDGNDKSWYIVPLCTGHNLKADELHITDSTVFISANASSTCGS